MILFGAAGSSALLDAEASVVVLITMAINALCVNQVHRNVVRVRSPIMLIVYYIFVVSYVIKAAYFGMFDWASPYFIATVRTHIGNESFVTALLVVTYCHVVIAILSRNISRSSAVLPQELKDLRSANDASSPL